MLVIALVTLCLGAALAQFFRVFVLVPSTIVGLVLLVVAGLFSGHGLLYATLESALLAFDLQLGYLVGYFVKRLIEDARAVRLLGIGERKRTIL
jgi:hypothetical protein